MKITICDVCAYTTGKISHADYKVGFRIMGAMSDVCKEHKNYYKQAKTPMDHITLDADFATALKMNVRDNLKFL